MTNIKLTNKTKVVLLSIISILILALTLTYAFMAPIIGNKAKTKVDITAGKLDKLTFIEGDPINLLLNQSTLGEGEGNVVGSTSSSAKLIANDTTHEAEVEYDVYFNIAKNEFFYTTDEEIPEMILTIKDPSNNNITSIEGLTYISGDISGFDITDKKGKILVKEGHIITTTSSTTGTTETWTATITFINLETDQGDIEGMSMSANLVLQDPNEITFDELILLNNDGKDAIEQKSHAFNAVEKDNMGMYAMTDDYTSVTGNNSYYFRGAVDNNWVKFGKEDNKDIWWRIVRINGDGSVKLIYTGTTGPQSSNESVIITGEGTQIKVDNETTTAFNTKYNKGEYIGYMYEETKHRGHKDDSTIKDFIDTWYEEHFLNTDYEEYLSDFVVCNDRGFITDNWEPIGLPTSEEGTQYSDAYRRLRTTNTPKLTCTDKEDSYTVDDTIIGNGELTYPIGLLTADEATLAGGYRTTNNSSYYLYTNQHYWSVSPCYVSINSAGGFYVYSSGVVSFSTVDDTFGVRPTVSLSSDLSVSGSGFWDDPYVIK